MTQLTLLPSTTVSPESLDTGKRQARKVGTPAPARKLLTQQSVDQAIK